MDDAGRVFEHFPELEEDQKKKFIELGNIFRRLNAQVNLVSRKDIQFLYEKHILHSLGIAKCVSFPSGSSVLDVGTGGGLPGIPLAIFFPSARFTLVDSIGKKINAVNEIIQGLELTNARAINSRVESMDGTFDFIAARAVSSPSVFLPLIAKRFNGNRRGGLYYLRGMDDEKDLKMLNRRYEVFPLSKYFPEEYFSTKAVVHMPLTG